MPKYKYKAKDFHGKTSRGIMDAIDEEELYQKLKNRNLFLEKAQLDLQVTARKRLKTKLLADFCRELGMLLQSGVSLVKAMNIICHSEGLKKQQKLIYEDILRLLCEGTSMSEAMEMQGDAFPELLIGMVKTAQASGGMDQAMLRMAQQYDKEYKLNAKLKNAMIYPAFLFALMIVVVFFIVGFILPGFQEIYDGMGTLPWPTMVLLDITAVIRQYWYLVLIGIVAAAAFMRSVFSITVVKVWKDKKIIHLPVIGKLMKSVYTARFTRTLSSLYSSGLPMLLSLQMARKIVGNAYIDYQFDRVITQVREGVNLSDALKTVDGFTYKLSSTVMIGEETGNLSKMLDAIADTLDYESEIAIARMTTMIEPCLILLMAVMVGFIMLAVMLPIIGSYSSVEYAAYTI